MEFVYLVTRTETLRERLDDQDRQERKAFDAVLPLWNTYLANPGAHWPMQRNAPGRCLQTGAATVCPGLPSVSKGLKTSPTSRRERPVSARFPTCTQRRSMVL